MSNIQEICDTMKKSKSKNNENRGSRRIPDQSHFPENIFNKIRGKNYPNLRTVMPIKVQEANRIRNRLDQKR